MERELKIDNIEGKSKFLSISSNELRYSSKRLRNKVEGGFGFNFKYFIIVTIVSFFSQNIFLIFL